MEVAGLRACICNLFWLFLVGGVPYYAVLIVIQVLGSAFGAAKN